MPAAPDLTIERVDTRILDVPLIRPHGFATMTATAQPILLVSVHLAGGVVGYGEGVVPGGPWWGGESVETMKVIVDRYLAPVMVGREVSDLAGILVDFGKVVANDRFAKASCDVAMHDAWARALGIPVRDLLGGAARDSIEVTWALGVLPLEKAVPEIEERIAEFGHRSFKLKMGSGDPTVDTGRIVQLAGELDGRVGLRIDVNARWDRMTALRHLPALAEAGIELFEQPTPADDLATLREITRRTGVPVMADESVCSPSDALAVVREEAADVIALKTTKLGGLRESVKTAAVAEAAGLACHGATSLEGPFGTAASLHFACATPAVNFGSELFGPMLLKESYTTTDLVYADGRVTLPEGPGLGLEPDAAAVSRFTRD
ncbi:muconate/chloromuconate family cycloisomerase [Corynebacterium nuruki]|uniref:Chloromuconate cycloisomerase n=1 Tax=Corynebacterium nuruki TaxID=1032851 RepID=A0A3D4SYJ8_9CORY|nr:muconate/chloromuconate family cycloisomerase [Corynebacterium nuruki]MDN6437992.1 muconate/chloromuconate family cycloisomerase [Corynebacterium nuruki]HCT14332.1 chloromuconate cycloisomerase [Corynebacterium nuruki]